MAALQWCEHELRLRESPSRHVRGTVREVHALLPRLAGRLSPGLHIGNRHGAGAYLWGANYDNVRTRWAGQAMEMIS